MKRGARRPLDSRMIASGAGGAVEGDLGLHSQWRY
jgi:hypothetical protein